MGLFSQRPEQNEQWAALPAEPLRRQSEAERLQDAGATEFRVLGQTDIELSGSAAVTSIEIRASLPDDIPFGPEGDGE